MDESHQDSDVQRAASMHEEASWILQNGNLQAAPPPEWRLNANNVNTSDVLRSARSMISASSGDGVFRRLSSSERLRSLPYPNRQMQARARSAPWKQQQTKGKGGKSSGVLEFAVLRCVEEQQENMKWDSMIANGMLLLNENDNEEAIRQSIKESLKSKFPMIRSNDFQFVKLRQKKSSILELGLGTEYSFAVVKKNGGSRCIVPKN